MNRAARIIEGIKKLLDEIGRPVRLMEVCGTHTVSIFSHGIRGLLKGVEFLSGPGCPVCVTSARDVDAAILISKTPGVILATFGDMMRVPGSLGSLYGARAEGAQVRVVYSPLDALEIALKEKQRRVVFFATGFETTAPLIAATLLKAEAEMKEEDKRFSVYSACKLVPPALDALLTAPELTVDGFILPGHVSTVIGASPYGFIAARHKKPAVIAGFEAGDILEATLMLVSMMAGGRAEVKIQYAGAVRAEGNPKALGVMDTCFEPVDSLWRGIGIIRGSGLALKKRFFHMDAGAIFNVLPPEAPEPEGCSCGEVLRGFKSPPGCSLFGGVCTPETPVGACMVSSEGACAAYYKYGGGNG